MWKKPLSLFGGGGAFTIDFTSDTYIGDLWVYLGSPSEPVEVTLIADDADVAEIIITTDFAAGSTFQFTAINSGRFIGTGGAGGSGGDDNGATGTHGNAGGSGGHAIQSDTFDVSIDVDNGFLFGGGGGGGGGSYNDTGAGGTPGGGGGGGVGWGDASGGAAGSPTGSPLGAAGSAGSQLAIGNGGNGGTAATNDGGDGGDWGYAGIYGQFANPSTNRFGINQQGNGGAGGDGGSSFAPTNGASATFSGAKSEATLRSEGRIKGETDGKLVLFSEISETGFTMTATSDEVGFILLSTGVFRRQHSGGDVDYSTAWWVGNSFTPGNYFVFAPSNTEGGSPGWTVDPGASDTWYDLTVGESFKLGTTASIGSASGLIQIGRTGGHSGAEPTPIAQASGLLLTGIEFEP